MQLTYRSLLKKANRDVLLNILAERTKQDYELQAILKKEEIPAKVLGVTKAYEDVITSVLSKPVNKQPTYSLILTLEEDVWESVDEYIKVSYYNSRVDWLPEGTGYEKYKDNNCKFLGFGYDAWSVFADCDIVIDPLVVIKLGADNLLEKIAAEILWEQTFYGFTEEKLKEFKDMLNQRVEDIESGKIKTVKLKKKKGDKYEVHIPEDMVEMLAPAKKKRSNKKKK